MMRSATVFIWGHRVKYRRQWRGCHALRSQVAFDYCYLYNWNIDVSLIVFYSCKVILSTQMCPKLFCIYPWVSEWERERERERDWLLNVTINNILLIYVTAQRCGGGLKKLDLRSGFECHRHFVVFFDVPFQGLTLGPTFLHLFGETAPFQSPFTTRTGIRRIFSHLTPLGSPKGVYLLMKTLEDVNCHII